MSGNGAKFQIFKMKGLSFTINPAMMPYGLRLIWRTFLYSTGMGSRSMFITSRDSGSLGVLQCNFLPAGHCLIFILFMSSFALMMMLMEILAIRLTLMYTPLHAPVKVVLKRYWIQRASASARMLCPFPEYSPLFQNTILYHIRRSGWLW